jgi:thioredoxin reductase
LIKSEFAIIGGGPGGIAAAIEAAKAGVHVTLLDENERLGGQIYRQLEKGFKVTDPGVFGIDYEKGLELLSQFNSLSDRIQYLNNATVWGIFKDRTLAFTHGATSSKLRFSNLLLATGAYDRPMPFPGWTLPGVFSAGGAQKLVKTERVLPGEKILLAGTGPLQLVLAYQILKAGGKIEAILEASNISINWLKGLKGIWGNWDFLKEGWEYLRNIQKADVPLLRSHIILEAHGDGQVEEAVIAKVDKNWRPRLGTARKMQVDTICLGYGLVSTTELALLAECDHTYDLCLGGFIPVRTETLDTTVPGIYAVSDADAKKHIRRLQKRLDKLNRFRKVLDEMSMPRAGLYELANDDTVVCRCEEITLKEIKDAMADGATHSKDIKRMTRVGMGPCEGRMCGPALIEMMRCQPNAHPDALECLPPRPSIKPIALGVLAASGRGNTSNDE